MKTLRKPLKSRGFTLMELMVAMVITTIIVTVLVSVTSIAIDTWNRSRAELRASRQAKVMIDTMARDFEALVVRNGNSSEWLVAESQSDVGGNLKSSNASRLIFYTSATDRYDGDIAGGEGDVCCVGYQLDFRDPLSTSGNGEYETFVLTRVIVDPDETFEDLLGEEDLTAVFPTGFDDPKNFVCENVFQFTVTFFVETTKEVNGENQPVTIPVFVGSSTGSQITSDFSIRGNGIESDVSSGAEDIEKGRVTAMELSLTVLTDYAVAQIRERSEFKNGIADFVGKNSYNYSKLIELPGM